MAALEGSGHTPDELEAFARSPLSLEQQEALRQLMLKAAGSPAPEDARLAAHLQSLLDPRERAWQRVIQAHEQDDTISAMVTEAVKGGGGKLRSVGLHTRLDARDGSTVTGI